MRRLRLYSFQKYLEETGYAKNTQRQYVSCMSQLKRAGITELSGSKEIRDAIYWLVPAEESRRMYLKAILAYERGIMKRDEALLKGAVRVQCFAENKENKYGKEPVKPLQSYVTVIAKCKNEGMKIAMLLQLRSGLRVGEINHLKTRDVTLRDNQIWLHVAPQKTKRERYVKALPDKHLYKLLSRYIEDKDEEDTLFSSSCSDPRMIHKYLKERINGQSHDLRRYNARLRYKGYREKGLRKKEALRLVGEQLGHVELVNTKRYLGEMYRNDRGRWKEKRS